MTNFNYKEQYGVIVICKDEKEQKEVFEMLQKQGFTLKVVTV
jgi:phage terminase large subunit-like protein